RSAPDHSGPDHIGPAARPVVVFSTVSWPRTGLATITLAFGDPGLPWLALSDETGADVPFLAEGVRRHPDGTLAETTITFRAHPGWGEGPGLPPPRGPGTGAAAGPAPVRAERCAIGSRLVTTFTLGGLRVSQETILWDGTDRVEFRTHVDGSIGQDALLRVRFPADVPGALPVYQCATSVVGRPFGTPDADVAQHAF